MEYLYNSIGRPDGKNRYAGFYADGLPILRFYEYTAMVRWAAPSAVSSCIFSDLRATSSGMLCEWCAYKGLRWILNSVIAVPSFPDTYYQPVSLMLRMRRVCLVLDNNRNSEDRLLRLTPEKAVSEVRLKADDMSDSWMCIYWDDSSRKNICILFNS